MSPQTFWHRRWFRWRNWRKWSRHSDRFHRVHGTAMNDYLSALLLLLTLNWEPVQVLLLFGALTGGATYMGSITAILFNIPGNASSAAAMIDGHAMARLGLPRTAIAAAATASAIGSIIGGLG